MKYRGHDAKRDATEIWSSGGGVQSTAIAALICQNEIPPPDLAVIVDTERELSTTWAYLDKWVMPELKKHGVVLYRVKKSRYATVDLNSPKGDILIPAFTTESGEIGKLPTYCSTEWKQRVMRRWAVEQGVKQANVWIGFSTDELRRVKQVTGKWQQSYPLISRGLSRNDCMALVERMGWPSPPRSSCWMCPNKSHEEWRWQQQHAPADFNLAVDFEKQIQAQDEDLWLTDVGKPIGGIDFSDDHGDLFTGRCDSGMCFV